MAAAEITERFVAMMTGEATDVSRVPTLPCVLLHDSAETPDAWYPDTNPDVSLGLFLLDDGDQGAFRSHKISRSIEQMVWKFWLIAHKGGELGVTQQRFELEQTLRTAWEDTKSLLTWPGNLNRGDTGWWNVTQLTCSANEARKDRLIKPCRFTATYEFVHREN